MKLRLRRRERTELWVPPTVTELQAQLRDAGLATVADHLLLAALEPQIVNALRNKGALPEDILGQVQAVIGTIASGAADDASEPVKVGGVVRVAQQASKTAGTRDDVTLNARGEVVVALTQNIGDGAITNNPGAFDDYSGTSRPGSAAGLLWNGLAWVFARTPFVFKIVPSIAVTAGTPVAAWTPAAGKKFRLLGYVLSASASVTILLKDNVTECFRTSVVAAAVANPSPFLGNGVLSALANNVLNIDVSAGGPITVGGVLFGTEE